MKQKISDAIVSYFMKSGVWMESKGENRIKMDIPMETTDGKEKSIAIEITFHDVSVRTIKEG